MARKEKGINCTNCGAGLPDLGGGRVKSLVCSYCGSVLDADKEFEVITQYLNMPHPDTPFKIGQTGRIKRVKFQIIGTMGMVERHAGQVWRWTEHQIFSPTRGYGWLTYENGHVSFTRKLRAIPGGTWWKASMLEHLETPPSFEYDNQRFHYHESSDAEIEFVDGAFNWIPALGNKARSVTFNGDNKAINFVTSNVSAITDDGEREVEVTEYLPPARTLKSFGAEPIEAPRGFNPLKPYVPWPEEGLAKQLSSYGAMVFLALGILVLGGNWMGWLGHRTLPAQYFSLDSLPQQVSFEVTKPGKLSVISFYSDVSNSWMWTSFVLFDPRGEPVFEGARTVEYYHGRTGGESWSEGSQRKDLSYIPKQAGTYTLILEDSESGTWIGGRRPEHPSRVGVAVREGMFAAKWFFAAAGLSWLIGYVWGIRRRGFLRRRYAASDWND